MPFSSLKPQLWNRSGEVSVYLHVTRLRKKWVDEGVNDWVRTEWTNTLEGKKLCPHKSVSWGISPNNITNTTPVNNNDWVPCVMFSSERCVFPRLLFVVQRLSVSILQTRKMGTETSHNGAGTCLPGLQLGAWSLHPYLHAHFGVFFLGTRIILSLRYPKWLVTWSHLQS